MSIFSFFSRTFSRTIFNRNNVNHDTKITDPIEFHYLLDKHSKSWFFKGRKVKNLIENTDPSLWNNIKQTILLEEKVLAEPSVTQALLAKGAKVNVTTNDEKTPLNIAINKSHFNTAKHLLNHGATISITSQADKNALLHLTKHEKMRLFTKALTQTDAKNQITLTPQLKDIIAVLGYLCEKDKFDKKSTLPIHSGGIYYHDPLLNYLLISSSFSHCHHGHTYHGHVGNSFNCDVGEMGKLGPLLILIALTLFVIAVGTIGAVMIYDAVEKSKTRKELKESLREILASLPDSVLLECLSDPDISPTVKKHLPKALGKVTTSPEELSSPAYKVEINLAPAAEKCTKIYAIQSPSLTKEIETLLRAADEKHHYQKSLTTTYARSAQQVIRSLAVYHNQSSLELLKDNNFREVFIDALAPITTVHCLSQSITLPSPAKVAERILKDERMDLQPKGLTSETNLNPVNKYTHYNHYFPIKKMQHVIG